MINVETASTETILYAKDKNKFTELLPTLSEGYVRMAYFSSKTKICKLLRNYFSLQNDL